jgi:hypothetical protein
LIIGNGIGKRGRTGLQSRSCFLEWKKLGNPMIRRGEGTQTKPSYHANSSEDVLATESEKAENKNKEKPYEEVQKKLRFDGVELPRIRNSEGTKEKGPKRPDKPRREDPDSEDDEEVRETMPRPPMPPKSSSSQNDNRLPIREPNPRHLDNEMSKDNRPKGPKFHLQSEVHKPGIEEAVAAKIMDSKVELTSEELAVLSPGVCRIIVRKMQNQRVKP